MEPLLVALASTVLAVVVGQAIRRRVAFLAQVESSSMAPTLAPGQRLVTRRQGVGRPVRRGDVVVVFSTEVGRPLVKRVVGLPGERVDVRAGGRVQVAGHDLVEPYVRYQGGGPRTFQVPAGHLLLLGDNRARSSDARVWREPYVPLSAVLGRVVPLGWPSAAGGPGREPPRSAAVPGG